MANVFFRLSLAVRMPMGIAKMATVRGAAEANQPAAPRLMPYSFIINGRRGPADAQTRPPQLRTRIASDWITNR